MTQPEPPPIPPPEPPMEACCGRGCDPCIFDLYERELERYRARLRAWQEKNGLSA